MKILIVDDHVLVRDGVILILKRMDSALTALVADTCEQALEILDEEADVDLVLLDLGLPGVSGLDAISAIRTHTADVPLVVLSASDDSETIVDAIQRGAMGFIPKKHSSHLMIGALELIIRYKGIYLPPSILPRPPSSKPQAPARTTKKELKYTLPRDIGITPKQVQVLRLLLEGKTNKAIAKVMGVEPGTIKIHISAVFRALGVSTRTEAIIRTHELKLVLSDKLPD